ncbi:hypothetical protein Rcae01_01766 [Novipirellula caenicola]|uniref:Uncharacterized protein n=1 Tax=Novipirellula caenicola TaxID=1536901 RepID=A0ABP9VM80_9BACT
MGSPRQPPAAPSPETTKPCPSAMVRLPHWPSAVKHFLVASFAQEVAIHICTAIIHALLGGAAIRCFDRGVDRLLYRFIDTRDGLTRFKPPLTLLFPA